MDDDTFSDSDSSSSDGAFWGAYAGSSMGSSGRNGSGGGCALLIIVVVLLLVLWTAMSGENYHGDRRERQTKAMIDAWAAARNDTAKNHSCKHERSRAICDVTLATGVVKHVECGKGGCAER